MHRRLLHVSLAAVAVAAGACATILDIQTLSYAPDAGVDAAPEDAADAAEEPVTCTPLHAPGAPDAGDDGAGTDFTLALSSLSAGIDNPELVDNYFDLDQVCTCTIANAESCTRVTPDGGMPAPETCDLSQGRDATGNRSISALLQGVPGFTDSNLATQFKAGKYGALLSVRGYNGLPDDPHVRVDLAGSYGCGTVSAGVLTLQAPKFDGTDPWTYDPKIVSADDGTVVTSIFVDNAAYVAGGVLVAHFPVAVVYLQFDISNSNQIAIRLTNTVVSGTLFRTDAGGAYEMTEGRIAGRVTPGDIAKAFSVWKDPIDNLVVDKNLGICPPLGSFPGSSVFKTIEAGLCPRVDLRANPVDDGQNLPCDATSFGLGFTAGPTKIGGPYAFPYKDTSCFTGSTFDPVKIGAPICN